jgi:hypothetical protein
MDDGGVPPVLAVVHAEAQLPFEQELKPDWQVSRVCERNDGHLAYPDHLMQDDLGPLEQGQRIEQQNDVEAQIGVILKPFVDVALVYAKAALEALPCPFLGDLDSVSLDLPVFFEEPQEPPIAAA